MEQPGANPIFNLILVVVERIEWSGLLYTSPSIATDPPAATLSVRSLDTS